MFSIQRGFTLIEVLVSIVVLALGVIGVAGMQLTALRTTQQSAFQSAAVELASEMAEKMRANADQMKLADEANTFLQVDYKSIDTDPSPPGILCHEKNANCDAAALAKFDVYEWEKRIRAALPGGRAMICRDSSPWDSSAGSFTWTCASKSGAATNTSVIIKIGWLGKGSKPDGSTGNDASTQFPPSVAITVSPYTK